MAEYHVGCGAFAIYAGTLNKRGDKWLHKSEVTHEALDAVAGYLVMNDKHMSFYYKDERYVLKVEKIEKIEEGDEHD